MTEIHPIGDDGDMGLTGAVEWKMTDVVGEEWSYWADNE